MRRRKKGLLNGESRVSDQRRPYARDVASLRRVIDPVVPRFCKRGFFYKKEGSGGRGLKIEWVSAVRKGVLRKRVDGGTDLLLYFSIQGTIRLHLRSPGA